MEIKKIDLSKSSVVKFKRLKTEIHLLDDISNSLFSKEIFLKKFKLNNYFAIDKNNLLGYIIYDIEKEAGNKFCLIYGIHLCKKARNKGIGKRLMSQVLAEMENKKIGKIILDVSKDNKKAQKFYRNFGFSVDSYRMKLGL